MGSEGKAPEEAQDRKRWDYDSDTAQELVDHISKRVEGDQNFINYGERLDESERKTAVSNLIRSPSHTTTLCTRAPRFRAR